MKTAIVTGGTQGIGKAISMMLLKKGYRVIATYGHNKEQAEMTSCELINFGDYQALLVDQADKESVHIFTKAILQNEPSIDCIVCNAGATVRKPFVELLDQDWETVINVTLSSHFYIVRDLYPLIPHQSRIVFIGSMMGVLPHSMSLPYGVSKAALHALAMNLVKEFADSGTTVNAIAPGFVETPWQKNKPEEIRRNIYRKTALGRFATPDEVASAVEFCLDNAYVNGALIEVHGGYCYK